MNGYLLLNCKAYIEVGGYLGGQDYLLVIAGSEDNLDDLDYLLLILGECGLLS